MKISFETSDRRVAGQDKGLKVRYGPAKRTAFRLRWYLILLLVASPVLYFLYTLATDAFSNEVPAIVWHPQHELLAQVPGFVKTIDVEPWERVQQGQPVVWKDSPALTDEIRQIDGEISQLGERIDDLAQRQATDLDHRISLLEASLAEYREQERRLNQLIEANAASETELLPVRTERTRLHERLAELQGERERLPRSNDLSSWPDAMQIRHDQLQADRARSERQQAMLTKDFDLDGVVTEILAKPGQFVDTGTPLLRYSGTRLRVIAYVEPRHLERRIETGRAVKLILPDNTRQTAIVRDTTGVAAQLPAALRTGFGGEVSTVPVVVEPEEPLPRTWRVDQLPLRVAF